MGLEATREERLRKLVTKMSGSRDGSTRRRPCRWPEVEFTVHSDEVLACLEEERGSKVVFVVNRCFTADSADTDERRPQTCFIELV